MRAPVDHASGDGKQEGGYNAVRKHLQHCAGNAERVGRGQVNRAPSTKWRDYGRIVARNVFTWFNAMVTPAAIALVVLKEYQAAIAVSGMAIVNTLIGLVQDHELKLEAIRALRGHRHPSTIDCFVRLLRLGHEEPTVAKEMLDAIYEWTDRLVEYRGREVESFERWWQENRGEWLKAGPGPR